MKEKPRNTQYPDNTYDNITGKPFHICKQESRITRLEKRQDDTIKSINTKLEKIWKAINTGDQENTKQLIQITGYFIGAMVTIMVTFLAFIKLT